MANTNRTDVTIKGSKEAMEYFQEKYNNCIDGKYPAEEGETHIIDAFGAEAELLIDRIGSKWISKYDVFIEADDEFQFAMESAWYPPSDMLKEMHRQLVAIDPDVTFTARYWDEAYSPIGVLKITDAGQYLTLETEPESEDDFDDEDGMLSFWDEVIDPEFVRLEEELGIA